MLSPGIRFMIYSVLMISMMHACVKALQPIPISEIILFRSVISIVLCAVILKSKKIKFPGENVYLLLVRGLLGCASIFTFFYSLQHMPLASAVTISYLSPLFIAFAAHFYLKEKLNPWQWFLLMISFIGVYLIKGYDMRINGYELIICVLAAIFSALAHFSIRLIKKDNDPWVIIFYFTLVTIPLSLPFAISDWINPNFSEFILLIIVGLLSHYGQYFLTAAYQQEDVSKISPIYFLGVAISLFLGYTFFNETFNFLSSIGIGIILTGTFLNLKLSIKAREA